MMSSRNGLLKAKCEHVLRVLSIFSRYGYCSARSIFSSSLLPSLHFISLFFFFLLCCQEYGVCNVLQCAKCGIWWNWATRDTGKDSRALKVATHSLRHLFALLVR